MPKAIDGNGTSAGGALAGGEAPANNPLFMIGGSGEEAATFSVAIIILLVLLGLLFVIVGAAVLRSRLARKKTRRPSSVKMSREDARKMQQEMRLKEALGNSDRDLQSRSFDDIVAAGSTVGSTDSPPPPSFAEVPSNIETPQSSFSGATPTELFASAHY